jgi:predicted N-acyltransferase
MVVSTLTSIAEVEPARWNAIVAKNRLICRHEYLRAVEASQINDCRYFYPVIREGDEIVAHACVYFISTELDSFARGSLKRAINGVRRIWKDFLILHSMECGTPVALGATISFREGTGKRAALMQIVHETEQLARKLRVGVVLFRDFYEDELTFFDQLRHAGYRRIHNLPCARMQIQWQSFDEFLRAMRSEYRCKILTRIKKFQKGGGRIELLTDFSPYAEGLARLWRNTYDRAVEYRREILLSDFFENVDQYLGNRSAVIVASIGGQPMGFLLLFLDDDTMTTIFSGLDYSCSKEHFVYFNLFYKAIEFAILRGVKDIDFGITTIAPKIELGAVVAPLFMYMKHLSPIWNRIVPRLFEMMTPKSSQCFRNIFKK